MKLLPPPRPTTLSNAHGAKCALHCGLNVLKVLCWKLIWLTLLMPAFSSHTFVELLQCQVLQCALLLLFLLSFAGGPFYFIDDDY